MSTKTRLVLSLDEDQLIEFEKIADAEHMKPNSFGALIISKFADLKQGHGLAALTDIPKEHFKLRPGRHPSSPSFANAGNAATAS